MDATLEEYRRTIDALDHQLIQLLARRLIVCSQVAKHKQEQGIAVMQPGRVEEVKALAVRRGRDVGLRSEFVLALYRLIIDEACTKEREIMSQSEGCADPS